LLVIGCGDVGQRLARLVCRDWKVYGVARSTETLARVRHAGAVPLAAGSPRRRVERLADRVVLAAPPEPAAGAADGTPGVVDPLTRRVAARLLRGSIAGRPVRLVYLGTTGVYGDRAGRSTDETTPIRPASARARRRAAAERWLRRTAAQSPRLQVSLLRIPGIYAAERLPLARLADRLPALRREDDVVTNHIHAEDLAGIIRMALLRARPQRVYNAVDDTAMAMGDYLDAVATWAGLPLPPRLARKALLDRVTPLRASFMSESRRLSNRRMKRELRVRLRHPTVASFLASISRPPRDGPQQRI
jgi:nucleoside-diphosphate-sugar epimerase